MKKIIAILMVSMLVGCSSFREGLDSIGAWEAEDLVKETVIPIDLISLISDGNASGLDSSGKPLEPIAYARKFDEEVAKWALLDETNYKRRRSTVQDRLKLNSDRLCSDYKTKIAKRQARGNFTLGITSLVFSTTGALVSNLEAARNFSAGAAIATGTRSELNQTYYLNQTFALINSAIAKQQDKKYIQMQGLRKFSPEEYTILMAINDVILYHGACSLSGAVELADTAIKSYDVSAAANQALDTLTRIKQIKTTTNENASPVTTSDSPKTEPPSATTPIR